MLVAEPTYKRRYGSYSAGLLAYEPVDLADYGFIKINVGKFFKRTVVGGVKKVVKTVKKQPWLAAAAIAGVGGLAYAAHAGYLAPVAAKLTEAKWALSAKLAPVTARAGALIEHRIVKPVSAAFAKKAIAKALVKPVKKPAAMSPISAGITASPEKVTVKQEPSIIGGVLRTAAKTLTPTLAQTANVLLQTSLAKKGLYYPYPSAGMQAPDIPYGAKTASPVKQEVYTTQELLPRRYPPPAPQQAGLAQMFGGIPIPLLIIGGVGILAILLLTMRGSSAPTPVYMPMPMPYTTR